jgi:NADH:ubiquinone oxidoreductase subunit 4 (subunit M)
LGTEWVALLLLVGILVLFGVLPKLIVGPIDTATVPLLMHMGVLR